MIRNLQAVLEAGGRGLDRVVNVTVSLSDWKYFGEMNEVYAEFFGSDHPPVRSTVQGDRASIGRQGAADKRGAAGRS